jgi:DNA-binding transcriptional regulator YdaS (Cro superfamily)
VDAVEKISLSDFVKKIGQAKVARALGVKPASIAKALKMRRNIEVAVAEDGACVAQEVRPFPSHVADDQDAKQAKSSSAA